MARIHQNTPSRKIVVNQIINDLKKIYNAEFEIVNKQGEEYFQDKKRHYGFNMKYNDLKTIGYDSIDLANFVLDIEEKTQEELGEGIDLTNLLDNPEILGDLGDKTKKLTPYNIIKFIELKHHLNKVGVR